MRPRFFWSSSVCLDRFNEQVGSELLVLTRRKRWTLFDVCWTQREEPASRSWFYLLARSSRILNVLFLVLMRLMQHVVQWWSPLMCSGFVMDSLNPHDLGAVVLKKTADLSLFDAKSVSVVVCRYVHAWRFIDRLAHVTRRNFTWTLTVQIHHVELSAHVSGLFWDRRV